MRFEVAFPLGVYLIGEVEPVVDYDRSTKESKVQKSDPESGKPLWQVTCLDPDPEAKKAQKTVTVKIPANVAPVPPENKDSSPFTPVVFEGLTALPWIEESGNFSKISWSFQAEAMAAPGKKTSNGTGTGAASSGSSSASSSGASSSSSSSAAA